MGTSLLAMSWGLEKTGLFPGIAINILIAAICLYTAYILLSVNEKHSKKFILFSQYVYQTRILALNRHKYVYIN